MPTPSSPKPRGADWSWPAGSRNGWRSRPSACWPCPERPLLIEATRLGAPSPRNQDVSVVLDLMIHDLDIALSLAGGAPLTVEAEGARSAPPVCSTRFAPRSCSTTAWWRDFTRPAWRRRPSAGCGSAISSGAVDIDFMTGELRNDDGLSPRPELRRHARLAGPIERQPREVPVGGERRGPPYWPMPEMASERSIWRSPSSRQRTASPFCGRIDPPQPPSSRTEGAQRRTSRDPGRSFRRGLTGSRNYTALRSVAWGMHGHGGNLINKNAKCRTGPRPWTCRQQFAVRN